MTVGPIPRQPAAGIDRLDHHVRDVARRLAPRRPSSRALAVVAAVLVASAGVHLVVHLLDDRSWWAVDAWRKAVTFPFAFGLTTLATAWVLDRLPSRRWLAVTVAVGTAGPAVVESVAVTVQAWRGVPSHFNVATPFDAAVFQAMGIAIAVQALATTVLLGWAVVALRRSDRATRLAVVTGLALLLVGAGSTGGAMIARGQEVVAATGAPGSTLIGAAGSLKVAHAVAIHGLEVLLVGLAVVEARGLAATRRARVTGWLAGGLAVLFGGTAWQAASGMSITTVAAPMVVAAVGLVTVVGAVAAGVTLPRPPAPRGTATPVLATVGGRHRDLVD